eukprot:199396-Chlamydomonas_euryale.AAC.6
MGLHQATHGGACQCALGTGVCQCILSMRYANAQGMPMCPQHRVQSSSQAPSQPSIRLPVRMYTRPLPQRASEPASRPASQPASHPARPSFHSQVELAELRAVAVIVGDVTQRLALDA